MEPPLTREDEVRPDAERAAERLGDRGSLTLSDAEDENARTDALGAEDERLGRPARLSEPRSTPICVLTPREALVDEPGRAEARPRLASSKETMFERDAKKELPLHVLVRL